MGKLLEQTVFEAFKTIIYYFKTSYAAPLLNPLPQSSG